MPVRLACAVPSALKKCAVTAEITHFLAAATPPGGENAYLARKGVGAHGVRFDGDRLVVPVRDVDGKLWSIQSISPEEGAPKMFEKGGRKSGNMHVMGELRPGAPVLVAEGYAPRARACAKPRARQSWSHSTPATWTRLWVP